MKYYTIPETAELLHCSVTTIRRRIYAGELKTQKNGKVYLISQETINDLIGEKPEEVLEVSEMTIIQKVERVQNYFKCCFPAIPVEEHREIEEILKSLQRNVKEEETQAQEKFGVLENYTSDLKEVTNQLNQAFKRFDTLASQLLAIMFEVNEAIAQYQKKPFEISDSQKEQLKNADESPQQLIDYLESIFTLIHHQQLMFAKISGDAQRTIREYKSNTE